MNDELIYGVYLPSVINQSREIFFFIETKIFQARKILIWIKKSFVYFY